MKISSYYQDFTKKRFLAFSIMIQCYGIYHLLRWYSGKCHRSCSKVNRGDFVIWALRMPQNYHRGHFPTFNFIAGGETIADGSSTTLSEQEAESSYLKEELQMSTINEERRRSPRLDGHCRILHHQTCWLRRHN
jgi:hypothetical protein